MEEKFVGVLLDYEDMMAQELMDIMAKKSNGMSFSEADICNGEKILKSIEHVERVLMMDSVEPEEDLMYGNNMYGTGRYNGSNRYQNNPMGKNQYSMNYGNSYRTGRSYGHNGNDLIKDIQQKMNMTNDPNEKMFLSNWIAELNNQ